MPSTRFNRIKMTRISVDNLAKACWIDQVPSNDNSVCNTYFHRAADVRKRYFFVATMTQKRDPIEPKHLGRRVEEPNNLVVQSFSRIVCCENGKINNSSKYIPFRL